MTLAEAPTRVGVVPFPDTMLSSGCRPVALGMGQHAEDLSHVQLPHPGNAPHALQHSWALAASVEGLRLWE